MRLKFPDGEIDEHRSVARGGLALSRSGRQGAVEGGGGGAEEFGVLGVTAPSAPTTWAAAVSTRRLIAGSAVESRSIAASSAMRSWSTASTNAGGTTMSRRVARPVA